MKKETEMLDFLKRLFGGEPEGKRDEDATTAPLSDQQVQSIMHGQNMPYEMQQLVAACGQSVGKQREHNEDSLLAITLSLAGKAANVPFGLYIVADGMGGHQYGEVASNAAVRVIAGQIMRKFHSYLFATPTQQPEESLQEMMESAVKEAHRTVQKDAPGSGTTVTAALILGQQVTIAHVGDSRAYTVSAAGR